MGPFPQLGPSNSSRRNMPSELAAKTERPSVAMLTPLTSPPTKLLMKLHLRELLVPESLFEFVATSNTISEFKLVVVRLKLSSRFLSQFRNGNRYSRGTSVTEVRLVSRHAELVHSDVDRGLFCKTNCPPSGHFIFPCSAFSSDVRKPSGAARSPIVQRVSQAALAADRCLASQ